MLIDAVVSSRVDDPAELAGLAERSGFDGLWMTESDYDPYLALAHACRSTERLTLGTAVATAFTRSPMVTAVAAWDLQRASGGRFVLGLGPQVRAHNLRRFSVAADAPAARLRELVEAVRHIWGAFQDEHPLDFHGRFYRHDLLSPAFDPGPIEHPTPPIFLAAVTPSAYRLAGAVADGVHVHPLHTAAYLCEVALPALDEGLASRGRERKDILLAAPVMVVMEGDAHADRTARSRLAFYGSTPTYRPVFETHGWSALADRLHAAMRIDDRATLEAAIDDNVLVECAISASSWTDAAEKVRARYDGLVDRVAVAGPDRKVNPRELEAVARAFRT